MIDEEALRKAFAALQKRVEYLERASGLFVPEAELDTPRGNPQVKFSPRGWSGDNFVGKHYSDCAPDFLEVLAETLEWAAAHPKTGKEKFAAYNKLDAARARTWARRLRAGGWTPPAAPERPAGRPTGSRPTSGGRPRRPATPPEDPPPTGAPSPPPPQHDTGAPLDQEDDHDDLFDEEIDADDGEDDWLYGDEQEDAHG